MDIANLLEEKRLKRFFSVKHKLIVENGLYHVTQRAPGREILFLEEADYLYFLHLLKETSKKFNVDVYAFALMPNHLHLFVYLNEKNLDKAMKKIFQRYAIYFNTKYCRKGHVFCGAYRCVLCNDERYALVTSLYIHLNPFKAGLAKNMQGYRWTSLEIYLNPEIKSFVKNDKILKFLDSDKEKAAAIYKNILKESSGIDYKSRWGTFKESKSIFELFFKKMEMLKIVVQKKNEKVFQPLNKKINALRMKKKLISSEDKKALIYTIEQLKSRGFNLTEAAEILGVSRTKIYRVANVTKSVLN